MPKKCFAACFLLKSWTQNFQGASFLDPWELEARFGKGKGRVKTVSRSLIQGRLRVPGFRGTPAPGSPGQEQVPACLRTPHPCITQLAVRRLERLQSFLPLCPGRAQVLWLSLIFPTLPQSSPPQGPCCPRDTEVQSGKGSNCRGTGISGSPGVPSHTGDS